MPWKCPACSTSIRSQLTESGDEAPRPARIYRCTVCRLELIVSDDRSLMIVAPMSEPDDHAA